MNASQTKEPRVTIWFVGKYWYTGNEFAQTHVGVKYGPSIVSVVSVEGLVFHGGGPCLAKV